MGGVGGLTVIIMQVSVQIGLNWYWTGTELGKRFKRFGYKKFSNFAMLSLNMVHPPLPDFKNFYIHDGFFIQKEWD